MARSQKKAYYVDPSLMSTFEKKKADGSFFKRIPIKTYSRRSTIIGDFVGGIFLVHNGKTFVSVSVVEEMIGHKFGEFALTRRFTKHPDKKSAKK